MVGCRCKERVGTSVLAKRNFGGRKDEAKA
jgi:hypothetical protein